MDPKKWCNNFPKGSTYGIVTIFIGQNVGKSTIIWMLLVGCFGEFLHVGIRSEFSTIKQNTRCRVLLPVT